MPYSSPLISLMAFLCLLVLSCSPNESDSSDQDGFEKVQFDLSAFNDQGLQGPPDGLRSQDYEFCIPAKSQYIEEVRQIDSTLAILEQARGRIGCSDKEYLCIGTTHQANFREVLKKLAAKPYIKRIDPCYYE